MTCLMKKKRNVQSIDRRLLRDLLYASIWYENEKILFIIISKGFNIVRFIYRGACVDFIIF